MFKLSGTTFKVDRRYKDLKGIGQGSYGVVASAFDTDCDRKVAIKKIRPMAAQTADAKHVLREVVKPQLYILLASDGSTHK